MLYRKPFARKKRIQNTFSLSLKTYFLTVLRRWKTNKTSKKTCEKKETKQRLLGSRLRKLWLFKCGRKSLTEMLNKKKMVMIMNRAGLTVITITECKAMRYLKKASELPKWVKKHKQTVFVGLVKLLKHPICK